MVPAHKTKAFRDKYKHYYKAKAEFRKLTDIRMRENKKS